MKHIFFLTVLLFFTSSIVAATTTIQSGIDQITHTPYLKFITNKNIALVVNNASVNADGKSDIDVLFQHPQVHLVALFSPEHGLNVHGVNYIKDGKHTKTGLPVYSLYGKHLSPTKESLHNVDVILIDLPDMGLRYFTYNATMVHVMKAAKKYHKTVIILDRVDPLGGDIVSGATLDTHYAEKFASYFVVPTRYGMTMGELARYYNRYHSLHANLLVVPLKHWKRSLLFHATGLPWMPPSPALQTFQQAFLYSIFGILESTNISVGGLGESNVEYRHYGAPWITANQAKLLVKKIIDLHLPGLSFQYKTWIPNRGVYKNKICRGFEVAVTDYHRVQDFYSLLTVLTTMHHVLGSAFHFGGMDQMMGASWVRHAIANQVPVQQIMVRSQQEYKDFLRKRAAVLLYSSQ